MPDNKLQQDPVVRLYDNIKNDYDLPDFNTFKADMSDSAKANKLHSALVKDGYDMPSFDVFSVDMGLKKKGSTTSRSLDAQSQLPLQKTKSLVPSPEPFLGNELQQGSIKEAALADKKKNESYLGAMWNNAVASVARLAGGATRFAYLTNTNPYAMMERSLLANASKITNKNLLAAKEKEIADAAKGFVEKARTSVSSKEYEKSISEGFDLTNGIGVSDLKALGQMIPQFAVDMGLGAVTGGGSFAIQGYDDALSMIDEIPEASNISEGTRIAFGLGGALVVGALDKLGLDNITKDPSVKRYVTAKIIKEATDEFVKKGVKIGAKQFEQAVIDKASKLTAKELTKLVASKTVKSAAIEGGTEAAQEAGMDLLKLAANKLEGKDIFNEEEMKDTAAKRYLNSFAAGGVLGGIGGSVVARVQNTQNAIKSKLEKAQTIEDIDAIVGEINESVSEGVMTQEEAEDILPIVENFVEVSKKLPESLNGKNKVVAVDLINERDKINNQLKEVEAKKLEIDPAFHGSLDADAKKIEERFNEINKELEELAKPENNIVNEVKEVEVLQPTEAKIPTTETSIEVVKPIAEIKEPSQEQQLKDIKDGNTVTFEYKNESEVPEIFKDKISSKGEINGKPYVKVTMAKSLADYELNKSKVTPIEAKIPTEEGKLKPEPIIVESKRVEVEPEAKEGVKVTTLSGMTESERAERVKERQKETGLNEREVNNNDLIKMADAAQVARGNEKSKIQGAIRQKVRELNAKLGDEVYRYNGVFIQVKSKSKKVGDRFIKAKGTSRDSSLGAIKEGSVLLMDRDENFKRKYEELVDSPNLTSLDVDRGDGVRMTETQIESAVQDIADGIPSVQANNLLNALEDGFNKNLFDLKDKTLGRVGATLDEFIGVDKEDVTIPMDEEALMAYLEDEANMTVEEKENLNDLISEYEQQPRIIEVEGEIPEAKPTTKEGGTKQPEPVKKREGEKEAYKDLTRNEKRQIINSKFDELLKELKIEKICPT